MKSLNKTLRKQIEETKNAIKQDERVFAYRMMIECIEGEPELAKNWEHQKQLQKELVQAKNYQLNTQITYLEEALKVLKDEIETHPLMQVHAEIYSSISEIQKEIEEIVFGE